MRWIAVLVLLAVAGCKNTTARVVIEKDWASPNFTTRAEIQIQ